MVATAAGRLPLARIAVRPELARPSARVAEILAAARDVLEHEGAEALTMRRTGEVLGIRAPSLYKHLAGKDVLTAGLAEAALVEVGDLLHEVVDRADADEVVAALLGAYRGYARAHPNLYRMFTVGRLPRAELSPGLEQWAGEPFYRATGDPYRAQALWAATHGAVLLELDGRYLPGSDLDRTYAALAEAFAAQPAGPPRRG
ncbi:TetR/AcrR family transcriptional regulator [Frankia sp. R82]|uniref:TetR/AcrR family transcriptional regulator n=1 Tax=Frankia sp. R82 TaxID=2950553 RepID=UPI0020441E29|nr:TetR/AcrR family transcriptional regulator [Frankia sp. R82]MCM3886911.1 TetR/AcrR family transcriptional regulator [Frankia sp. R82]